MMKIAADMTPVTAGGVNGGVVPLTVETIKGFCQWEDSEVILITASWNHELLAYMDQYGCRRVCLAGDGAMVRPLVMKNPFTHAQSIVNTNTEQPGIAVVSWKRKIYLKLKHYIKHKSPSKFYYFAKKHKDLIKHVLWAMAHPVQGILKPFIKFITPHGLYIRYSTRRTEQAMLALKKQEENAAPVPKVETTVELTYCDLEASLGEKIDILYCPFTAVNYQDPSVKTVSIVNDIQHEYYPFFFTTEDVMNFSCTSP